MRQLSNTIMLTAGCLLLQLLLSGPATANAVPEDTPNVVCPDLTGQTVCQAAPIGFSYSDGCNTVTCEDDGRFTTTLMACSGPSTGIERAHCHLQSRLVWSRLGPFTCLNIDAEEVCSRHGAGFSFSDGCNRVRCLRDGSPGATRMTCPITDPEGPYCRYRAEEVAGTSEARVPGGIVERPGEEEETQEPTSLACPSLAASRICEEFLAGFQYHDGCRNVTCIASGGLATHSPPRRRCPSPEPGNAAAEAFCRAAEQRMLRKKARSHFYTSCLDADSVCRLQRTAEMHFFDGCNRCFCLPDRSAACTRVACPPKYLTPEEFSDHCRQVGAGVLSLKKRRK